MLSERRFPFETDVFGVSRGFLLLKSVQNALRTSFSLWKTTFFEHLAGSCPRILPKCSQNVVFPLKNDVFGASHGFLPPNPSKMLSDCRFPFGKRRFPSISWVPASESVQNALRTSFSLWKTMFLEHPVDSLPPWTISRRARRARPSRNILF